MDQVLNVVFSYLAMLRRAGPSERIYSEIAKIERMEFEFGEEAQPSDNVEKLCENMQFFPPELYLSGDELMFDYDAGEIKR